VAQSVVGPEVKLQYQGQKKKKKSRIITLAFKAHLPGRQMTHASNLSNREEEARGFDT
jgi:hypothetical protein